MSYDNIHMEYPIDGLRFSQQAEITPEYLRKLGWEGILIWQTQLMGNSKFEDLSIIAAFLKGNLDLTAAAKIVGYKYHPSVVNWVSIRIRRHNSKSIMEFLRNMMLAGLLPKDCSKMLHTRHNNVSSAAKMIAVQIIEGAITKWGSKEKACEKLKITKYTVNYWLDKK